MADPLRLRVRLTPRGGRDRIDGWTESADGERLLKVRVAAPPVGGAANEALVRLISRELGVPKSAVTMTGGETARVKTITIDADPDEIGARLEALPRAD